MPRNHNRLQRRSGPLHIYSLGLISALQLCACDSKESATTDPSVGSASAKRAGSGTLVASASAASASAPKPKKPTKPSNEVKTPTGLMMRIPAGTFKMGSDTPGTFEKPVHEVNISAFLLDKYEVTVEAYQACVKEKKCTKTHWVTWKNIDPKDAKFWTKFCNLVQPGREKHPMNCLSHSNANAYCMWAGKRLPTAAEWEYAARGKESNKYPWGNDDPTPEHANVCGKDCRSNLIAKGKRWGKMFDDTDPHPETAPVGSYKKGASPFGVMDMAGNVWEWTNDWFSMGYYKSSPKEDPKGPGYGKRRSVRGGSWNDFKANNLRSSFRLSHEPSDRLANIGFRCAKSL